ncbi:hypothetical protein ACLOJK_036894 [Asimina triloba]
MYSSSNPNDSGSTRLDLQIEPGLSSLSISQSHLRRLLPSSSPAFDFFLSSFAVCHLLLVDCSCCPPSFLSQRRCLSTVDFFLSSIVFISGIIFLSGVVFPSSLSSIFIDLPPFPLPFRSFPLSSPFPIFLPSSATTVDSGLLFTDVVFLRLLCLAAWGCCLPFSFVTVVDNEFLFTIVVFPRLLCLVAYCTSLPATPPTLLRRLLYLATNHCFLYVI